MMRTPVPLRNCLTTSASQAETLTTTEKNHQRNLQDAQFFSGSIYDNETIVFTLTRFQDDGLGQTVSFWNTALEIANESGQTKLLIDLSGNPGGSIAQCYFLIMLLMPDASLDYFLNQWDINLNDAMAEWLDAGLPLLDDILKRFDGLSTEVREMEPTLGYKTFASYCSHGEEDL